MVETRTLTIKVGRTVTNSEVGFKVYRNGEPVEGAIVTLTMKIFPPVSFNMVTGFDGKAIFDSYWLAILYPMATPAQLIKFFEEASWLIGANIEGTSFGYFRDEIKYECGKVYSITLKKYKTAPKLRISIYLRNIIGAELFSNFIADVQSAALEQAGLEVTGIEGKGTKKITIYFTLPWSEESPIVISWTAVWFILKVLAVAFAIIAILVVYKWTFGPVAPVIAGGLILLIILFLLLSVLPRKREEVRRR